jgi:hypothetical protein
VNQRNLDHIPDWLEELFFGPPKEETEMKNGTIKLATENGAPSRLLEKHSNARLQLAQLIARKLGIEDRVRALVEAGAKLKEAADAEGHAAAALSALDAEETRIMSTWSQGSGPMPVFDQTRRQKLEGAVHAAAAQAAAARKAAAANGAEQQRENATLKALEPEFAVLFAEIILESVEPLISDFEATNKVLATKAARLQAAFMTMRGIAESVGNPSAARPAFVIMEKLSEKLRTISGRAAPDDLNHAAAWMSYAAKLKSDPLAIFEG